MIVLAILALLIAITIAFVWIHVFIDGTVALTEEAIASGNPIKWCALEIAKIGTMIAKYAFVIVASIVALCIPVLTAMAAAKYNVDVITITGAFMCTSLIVGHGVFTMARKILNAA